MDSRGSTPTAGEPVGVEDRAAAIEVLRFVLAKWLTVHCPAAKASIAAFLLPPPPGQQQVQQRELETRKAAAMARVVVETMAGVVVGSFECDPATTTIDHVRLLVADENPAMPSRCQRLFLTGSTQFLEPKATLAECGVFAAGGGGGGDGGGKLVVVLANDPRWDPQISNKTLEFSLENRQVRRPGGRSSYPCARANFLLERVGDSFCVHIVTLESVSNALTIGVLAKGHEFKNASSSGVGGADGSAGLHIANVRTRMERKIGSNKSVALMSRREAIGPRMAMVEEGDRLRFTLRTGSQPHELVLALSVNDEHFFDIPLEGLPLPLRPLCTLPDNCKLELEP